MEVQFPCKLRQEKVILLSFPHMRMILLNTGRYMRNKIVYRVRMVILLVLIMPDSLQTEIVKALGHKNKSSFTNPARILKLFLKEALKP